MRETCTVSKDGRRKVKFKEVIIGVYMKLYLDNREILSILFNENIFELKNQGVLHRSYTDFADEFIEHGLGNRSLPDIYKDIYRDLDVSQRKILFFVISSDLTIEVSEGSFIMGIRTEDFQIHSVHSLAFNVYPFLNYSFDDFASKSLNEVLMLADSWYFMPYKVLYIDEDGQHIGVFLEQDIQFQTTESIFNEIDLVQYLIRINYQETHQFLKLSDENKKVIAKAKILGLAVKIESIDKNDFPVLTAVAL